MTTAFLAPRAPLLLLLYYEEIYGISIRGKSGAGRFRDFWQDAVPQVVWVTVSRYLAATREVHFLYLHVGGCT
jgi:hypothetical protein